MAETKTADRKPTGKSTSLQDLKEAAGGIKTAAVRSPDGDLRSPDQIREDAMSKGHTQPPLEPKPGKEQSVSMHELKGAAGSVKSAQVVSEKGTRTGDEIRKDAMTSKGQQPAMDKGNKTADAGNKASKTMHDLKKSAGGKEPPAKAR